MVRAVREEKRVSRKKIKVREKGRKAATHYVFHVFPMFCGPGGSKSRLAKAAGAEPFGGMRDEQLHAVVARGTFYFPNAQRRQVRSAVRP